MKKPIKCPFCKEIIIYQSSYEDRYQCENSNCESKFVLIFKNKIVCFYDFYMTYKNELFYLKFCKPNYLDHYPKGYISIFNKKECIYTVNEYIDLNNQFLNKFLERLLNLRSFK